MARKLELPKHGSFKITVPSAKVDDLNAEEGDWIKFETITRGRHAGKVALSLAEKEEEAREE